MQSYLRIVVTAATNQARAALAKTQAQLSTLHKTTTTASLSQAGLGSVVARQTPALTKWGNQLQWTGRQLQYNFSLPLALAGGAAVKWQLDNEKAFTRVTKVYGDTESAIADLMGRHEDWTRNTAQTRAAQIFQAELGALSEAFEELSNHYGVQQSEVLEIAGAWAAAGKSGVALAESTQTTLQAMVLGEIDAGKATTALIAIQAQYNFSSNELMETLAGLNAVENQTGTTMADLIDSMQRSAGAARTAGIDYRHLVAMTAALVPATGSAAAAGNGLRTIITRIMGPTKEAAQVFEALNLNIESTEWQSANAMERLILMSQAWDGLGASAQNVVGKVAASTWQVNRFSVLMRELLPETSYYEKALQATSDRTAMFTVMQRELNRVLSSSPQRLSQIWVMLQNAMADIIQPLIPHLLYLADAVKDAVTWFSNLAPATQHWIIAGLAALAIIGPLARYVGTTATLVSTLGRAFKFAAFHMGLFAVTTTLASGEIVKIRSQFFAFLKLLVLGPFVVFGKGVLKVFAAITVGFKAALWVMTLGLAVFWDFFIAGFAAVPRIVLASARGMVAFWAGSLAFMRGITAAAAVQISAVWSLQAAQGLSIWTRMWTALITITRAGSIAMAVTSTILVWPRMFATAGAGMIAAWRGVWVALVGITAAGMARIRVIWLAGALAGSSIFKRLGLVLVAIFASTRTALLLIATSLYRSLFIIFGGLISALTGLFIGLVFKLRVIGATIFAVLTSPWTLAIATVVGLIYVFRDQLAQIWSNLTGSAGGIGDFFDRLVQGIIDAWYMLPVGVQQALVAVVTVVREAALAVWEWMQYINPWATHSPSLVNSVRSGVDEISNQFNRLDGVTSVLAGAQQDIENFNQAMQSIQNSGMSLDQAEDRKSIAKANPAALDEFDALIARLGQLNQLQSQYENKISAQEGVVASWQATVDQATGAIERQQAKMESLQAVVDRHTSRMEDLQNVVARYQDQMESLQDVVDRAQDKQDALREVVEREQAALESLQNTVDRYQDKLESLQGTVDRYQDKMESLQGTLETFQQRLQGAQDDLAYYASAPLKGLDAMEDKIFRNEMAQKRLRLEMMKIEQAYGSLDELKDKISAINGQQELLRGEQASLRAAGAGGEILDQYDKEINRLDKQKSVYEDNIDKLEDMQDALDRLQRIAERLDLVKALKFDRLQRRIAEFAEDTEELTFEEIIDGITKSKNAIAKWTPKVEQASNAVKRQQEKIDEANAAVERQQDKIDKANDVVERQQDVIDKANDAVDRQQKAIDKANDAVERQQEKIDKANDAVEDYQDVIDKATEAVERQQKVVDRYTKRRDKLAESLETEQDKLSDLNDKYSGIQSTIGDVTGAIDGMTQAIKDSSKAAEAAEYISPGLQSLLDAGNADFPDPGGTGSQLRDNWQSQVGDIEKFTDRIANQTSSMFADLNPFKPLLEKGKEIWDKVWSAIKSGARTTWNWLGGLFEGIDWGVDLGGLRTVWNKVENVIETSLDVIYHAWELLGPEVKKFFTNLADGVVEIWKQIWPELKQFGPVLKDLWTNLKPIIGGILLAFLVAVKAVLSAVNKSLGPAIEGIAGIISSAVQALRGVFKVISGILKIISGIISGVIKLLTGDFDGALDSFKIALGGLGEVFEGLGTIIGGVFRGIWHLIKGVIKTVLGAIQGFVEGIRDFFQWLYDVLVGHSVVVALVKLIIKTFGLLIKPITGTMKLLWRVIKSPVSLIKGAFNGVKTLLGGVAKAFGTVARAAAPAGRAIASAAKFATGSATGLGAAAKLGAVGVVGAGASTLISKMANDSEALNNELTSVTTGLAKMGQTGNDQIPALTNLSSGWTNLGDVAAELAWEQDSILGKMDSMGGSASNLDERMGQVDTALAALADKSGPQAAAAFKQIAKQAEEQGLSVERLKEMLPQYASAAERASARARAAARQAAIVAEATARRQREAQEEASKSWLDLAEDVGGVSQALKGLQSKLGATGTSMLDSRSSARDMEQAYADARKAIKQNGATLDIHTSAGRANQEQLDTLALSSKDYLSTLDTKDPELFIRKLREQRTQLRAVAERFGMSESAAKKYARQVLSIPKNVNTKVVIEAAAALRAAKQIANRLSELPKRQQIEITTRLATRHLRRGGDEIADAPQAVRSNRDYKPDRRRKRAHNVDWLPNIPAYQHGGPVGGRGGVDNNLARVSRDEFIVNAKSSRRHRRLLEMLNRTGGAGRLAFGTNLPLGFDTRPAKRGVRDWDDAGDSVKRIMAGMKDSMKDFDKASYRVMENSGDSLKGFNKINSRVMGDSEDVVKDFEKVMDRCMVDAQGYVKNFHKGNKKYMNGASSDVKDFYKDNSGYMKDVGKDLDGLRRGGLLDFRKEWDDVIRVGAPKDADDMRKKVDKHLGDTGGYLKDLRTGALKDFNKDWHQGIYKDVPKDANSMSSDIQTVKGDVAGYLRDLGKIAEEDIDNKFSQGAKNIGKAWGDVEGETKGPIRYVVNTVLNDALIKSFNKIANFVDGKKLDNISLPPGFYAGGPIPGSSPTDRADNIPIMATAGEYMVRRPAVRRLEREDPGILNHINKYGTIHGFNRQRGSRARGGDPGDYARLGFAQGGEIDPSVRKRFERGLAWAKRTAGNPNIGYVLGAEGPLDFDCSSWLSSVANVITGKADIYNRLGTSSSAPNWSGFNPGPGLFSIGYAYPYPGSDYGHVSGTLLGTNIENSGSAGPHWGRNALPANAPGFSGIMHMGPEGALGVWENIAALPEWAKEIARNPDRWAKGILDAKLREGVGFNRLVQDTLSRLAAPSALWAAGQFGEADLGGGGRSLWHASPARARAYAQAQLRRHGWGAGQWEPLRSLWTKESNWRWNADNPTSSAYGIPQSLPGSKMGAAGPDWRGNAATQIDWGLSYIKGRYGTPTDAWRHSQQNNWYAQGGLVELARGGIIRSSRGGRLAVVGEGSNDEAVMPLPRDWRGQGLFGQRGEGQGRTLNFYGDLSFPNITSGDDAETFITNLEILSRD